MCIIGFSDSSLIISILRYSNYISIFENVDFSPFVNYLWFSHKDACFSFSSFSFYLILSYFL